MKKKSDEEAEKDGRKMGLFLGNQTTSKQCRWKLYGLVNLRDNAMKFRDRSFYYKTTWLMLCI